MPCVGDVDALLGEVEEFVTGARRPQADERVLATMLFTDIVDSTAHGGGVGDGRWRELLDALGRHGPPPARRYRGGRSTRTGDGLLATFDGPARAIRCATAIRDASQALELAVRAGLHTGECELRDDDIGGIAVHIARPGRALAAPDEVLVSSTVGDLVAGSGLEFTLRGATPSRAFPRVGAAGPPARAHRHQRIARRAAARAARAH